VGPARKEQAGKGGKQDSLDQNKPGRGQEEIGGTYLSDPERAPAGLDRLKLGIKLAARVNVEKVSGGALGITTHSPVNFRLPPSQLVLI
jgi:hypothetical protein